MKDTDHSNPMVEQAKEELMLLYDDGSLVSYTENVMRGEGVVSIDPELGSSIKLYTPGNMFFGEIKYNNDFTFTLKLPGEIIARRVIPNSDFMAFAFDAENPDSDEEYLHIYINKTRMKIKKADNDYTYLPWEEYVKYEIIELKPNNLLHVQKNDENVLEPHSNEHVFEVTGITGNVMNLVSTNSGCCKHPEHEIFDGWVRWKHNDILLINFVID